MKKFLVFGLVILMVIGISGCGLKDIKSGKVPTETYLIKSTNIDHENNFTLVPIVIYTGKTTTTSLVPMWNDVKYLKIKYINDKQVKKIRTNSFDVVKTKKHPYIKVKQGTLHDNNPDVVAYLNEN